MSSSDIAKEWIKGAEEEFDLQLEALRRAARTCCTNAFNGLWERPSDSDMRQAAEYIKESLSHVHRWLAMHDARAILRMENLVEQIEQEGKESECPTN